jgi:hypothetical protein
LAANSFVTGDIPSRPYNYQELSGAIGFAAPIKLVSLSFTFVGVAGLLSAILRGRKLKEKAFYSLRSFKGFVFHSHMQASLQRSEKQNPFSFR